MCDVWWATSTDLFVRLVYGIYPGYSALDVLSDESYVPVCCMGSFYWGPDYDYHDALVLCHDDSAVVGVALAVLVESAWCSAGLGSCAWLVEKMLIWCAVCVWSDVVRDVSSFGELRSCDDSSVCRGELYWCHYDAWYSVLRSVVSDDSGVDDLSAVSVARPYDVAHVGALGWDEEVLVVPVLEWSDVASFGLDAVEAVWSAWSMVLYDLVLGDYCGVSAADVDSLASGLSLGCHYAHACDARVEHEYADDVVPVVGWVWASCCSSDSDLSHWMLVGVVSRVDLVCCNSIVESDVSMRCCGVGMLVVNLLLLCL